MDIYLPILNLGEDLQKYPLIHVVELDIKDESWKCRKIIKFHGQAKSKPTYFNLFY